MRLLLVKSVLLLLLLNGAISSYAHAASLAYEFNRVSNNSAEDLGPQLGMRITEQPQAARGSFDSQATPANLPGGNRIGFLTSFSGDANAKSVEGGVGTKGVMKNGVKGVDEWVSFLGLWANAGSFDGLIAAFSDGHFRVGLHAQAIGLAGHTDSYVGQLSPVPLPAAAWLFASALFGFVVVASRRKA